MFWTNVNIRLLLSCNQHSTYLNGLTHDEYISKILKILKMGVNIINRCLRIINKMNNANVNSNIYEKLHDMITFLDEFVST